MEIKEIELKERTITIFNDVEESSMSAAIEKIFQINQNDEEWIRNLYNILNASCAKFDSSVVEMPHIQVLLSTYGGDVYDGISTTEESNLAQDAFRILYKFLIHSSSL